jgi:small subunit ribosomal protein S21
MSDDPHHGKRGVSVKVYNNNINSALAQLKRKSNAEGINKELRKRKHFEPNTVKRQRKMAEAQMRWRKKQDQINEVVRPKRKPVARPQQGARPAATTATTNTTATNT